MASPEEIVSIALTRLGAESILDFQEDTKNARLGKTMYDAMRKTLLRKYDWSFARKVVRLALVSEFPLSGYNYAYALPSDCLNPVRIVNYKNPRVKWEVFGKELHANVGVFVLRYTYDCDNSGLFSPSFVDALAMRISAELCPGIVQDKALTRELKSDALILFYDAVDTDANLGIEYPVETEDPNYDSFVNPDITDNLDTDERI